MSCSAKNNMIQVASILGVELKEKFYINEISKENHSMFYIDEDGIHDEEGLCPPEYMQYLLTGRYTVIKFSQVKHTGIEDTITNDNPFYVLFSQHTPQTSVEITPMRANVCTFTNLEICKNWEKYIRIYKKLAQVASILNDEPIDWSVHSPKYYICCPDPYKRTLEVYQTKGIIYNNIYFTNYDNALKAISMVGKKNLLWMLLNFDPYINYSKAINN